MTDKDTERENITFSSFLDIPLTVRGITYVKHPDYASLVALALTIAELPENNDVDAIDVLVTCARDIMGEGVKQSKEPQAAEDGPHPSHVLTTHPQHPYRMACENCRATDKPRSWGWLAKPCAGVEEPKG